MGALSAIDTIDRLVATIEGRDADAYAALHAEHAVAHHPLSPSPLEGRDTIREAEQALFDQFTDVRVDVRSALHDDTAFALQVVLAATHESGRRIELPAVWWYRVEEESGLIVEARDYFDTALLAAQGLDAVVADG